ILHMGVFQTTVQKNGSSSSIFAEGVQRTSGKDAHRMNIVTARLVAETIKTTLGPRGMDKMLVDSLGDVTITNDGATILREMDIDHPIANMMINVARTQEIAAGDGTTTAVVIAGELLKKAEELLDQRIHPTIIANGYQMAAEKSKEILDSLAMDIALDDEETLKKIAMTTMTGKGVEKAKEHLAPIIVTALKTVISGENGSLTVNGEQIKVAVKEGANINETEYFEGIVIDKEKAHHSMPQRVENARIALINVPLDISSKEATSQIRFSDPSQLRAFAEEQKGMLQDMISYIKNSGANVVISTRNIDDLAQYYLAKENIMALRRIKKSDMEKLARATGANIIVNLEDLTEADLGFAGIVEEVKVADDFMTIIKECRNPKAVSILIRGETKQVAEEVERAVEDCLGAVGSALEDRKVLPGGGAVEIELSKRLQNYAKYVGGREQLAIEAFAEALEVIPTALAENAGFDPIDTLIAMKTQNEKYGFQMGLDVYDGQVKNMYNLGVIEPLRVKKVAIDSASQVTTMLLRIDDVIAAARLKKPTPDQVLAAQSTNQGAQ
ncbi:MAG: archaeal chaperonin, partial [Clostridia bacterium]|nr:archaeal chaperonin [Clostridia bacterium]